MHAGCLSLCSRVGPRGDRDNRPLRAAFGGLAGRRGLSRLMLTRQPVGGIANAGQVRCRQVCLHPSNARAHKLETVPTPDWDTYFMSESAGRHNDGLSVVGSSGLVCDVPRTDGVDIHVFCDGRRDCHVGEIQKYRVLVGVSSMSRRTTAAPVMRR